MKTANNFRDFSIPGSGFNTLNVLSVLIPLKPFESGTGIVRI